MPDLQHINIHITFQNSTDEGDQVDATSKMTKSSSLTSIPTSEPEKLIVDQSDIITLTQDVKCFSDGLNRLKTVFEDHGIYTIEIFPGSTMYMYHVFLTSLLVQIFSCPFNFALTHIKNAYITCIREKQLL